MSDDDVLKKLDASINAIETHRDWRSRQRLDEEEQVNIAWQELLAAAHKLREKLRENPKLRYFSIARDESELSISFHSRSGGSANVLSFFRRHPEGKYPTTNVIWCRQPGRDDRRYTVGQDAVDVLVQHCAGNLTAPD